VRGRRADHAGGFAEAEVAHRDKPAAFFARGNDDGAIVLARSLAAQDNATRHMQRIRHAVNTAPEQERAAMPVGVGRQRRDSIERGLDALAVIGRRASVFHYNRCECPDDRHGRQRHAAAVITGAGKVGDRIASFVGPIDEPVRRCIKRHRR
jgi:hypothetical protein